MKIKDIPGLMDWLKTLPAQWLADPDEWTMENWYLVNPHGTVASLLTIAPKELIEVFTKGTKEGLANMIRTVGIRSKAAALVQATEGWVMLLKNAGIPTTTEGIMEAYGPSEEAEKVRQRLGIQRVHALTIQAQTDEEAYLVSYAAYENPKALGEVLNEGAITDKAEGIFSNLLRR